MTYRQKRRQESANNYLCGNARHAYVLREDIAHGLIENQKDSESSCGCHETLGKFKDIFKSMQHNNIVSEKKPNTNRKLQNEWLLENIFDSHGNYIYCHSCIIKILNISGRRLQRLREIKRQQAEAPTMKLRKDQVLKEQIRDIVTPVNEVNVLSWWEDLKDNDIVEIRFLPKLHNGKSNNEKTDILPKFLSFIDNNSQPNGRKVSSHGPLYFFNSKFTRINTPSSSEKDKPEHWKRRSLVYEFNRTLEGNQKISNGTVKKWLKAYRPKHAISPKKTDYCVLCAECQEQQKRYETISIRLQQEGNSGENEIRECRALAESYRLLLDEHRMDAGFELEHYRKQTEKSRFIYNQIDELQKREKQSDPHKLKEQLVFSLSCDYQQSKLTPQWGLSAQPSETYYLRKLSHHIFGIVNHTFDKNAVYVLDERFVSAKNADTTISLVNHYIRHNLPAWARHLCLFMDCGATNKNQFMIQWAMEIVEKYNYDSIRLCFFVPGHGKNDVDRLFSRISQSYNNNDVFNTNQLLKLIQDSVGPRGTSINAGNRDIINWKSVLYNKYKSLKDIKNYREFLVKYNTQGKIVVYLRNCCYTGDYVERSLVKEDFDENYDLMENLSEFTYEARNMSPKLSEQKISDLAKMYGKFIDPALRPKWLSVSTIEAPIDVTFSKPCSELARKHRKQLKNCKGSKK